MRIKLTALAMLATVLATSCSNDEVVETNADPTGEAIDFRPSVAWTTRAEITRLQNLGNFYVYAKGVHSTSGALYKTFMVGDTDTGEPAVATRSSLAAETGTWRITNDVYWPSGVNTAIFWAFTDRKYEEDKGGDAAPCITSGSVKFLQTFGPQIENYQPLKADLTKPIDEENGWFDGDHQRDLVSAFRQQTKNPHVNLDFHHLLSQIEITAESKHTAQEVEMRTVKIKGAWIVNVVSQGSLNAGFTYDEKTQTAQDAPSWNQGSSLQQYGTYYYGDAETGAREVPVVVNGSPSPLNVLGKEGHGNLMLIPQTRVSWDGVSETTEGAYLLLLCRVDYAHIGEITADPDNEAVSGTNKDGLHYHQQFPITKYYDDDAYGLTAIPIPVNWEMGKKYTYNLDVCGENSGAGKYPPNIPTDPDELNKYLKTFVAGDFVTNAEKNPNPTTINIITTRPAGKNVGDYVLDDPIQFKVNVREWENAGTWVNGGESNVSEAD